MAAKRRKPGSTVDISPCEKDPENHGLDCKGARHCERCGWNPEFNRKRKEAQENEAVEN